MIEFGIITAPKDVGLDGLPEAAFNLRELRNNAGLEEENEVCRSLPEEFLRSCVADFETK